MRGETVQSAPTLGAGRRVSWFWWPGGVLSSNTVPANRAVISSRPDPETITSTMTVTDTGAPPTPRGGTQFAGRVAYAVTSDATTGTSHTPAFAPTNFPFVMPFQEVKSAQNPSAADDLACWSVKLIAAFDAIPGAIVGDIGLVLSTGGRKEIRGAPQWEGIEFGPTGTGTVGVLVRQVDAGAATFSQNVASPPNMSLYNSYEIRLISATASVEAQIKFLINGNQKFALSYGAGTLLPSQKDSAGASGLGFFPIVLNFKAHANTTRMYIPPYGLQVSGAPTEDALL